MSWDLLRHNVLESSRILFIHPGWPNFVHFSVDDRRFARHERRNNEHLLTSDTQEQVTRGRGRVVVCFRYPLQVGHRVPRIKRQDEMVLGHSEAVHSGDRLFFRQGNPVNPKAATAIPIPIYQAALSNPTHRGVIFQGQKIPTQSPQG
jgi:hypothetical protein